MMYLGKACFLDIPAVIAVNGDGLPMFNPRLPGYIRDLVSTRGPVIGLVPYDWHVESRRDVLTLLLPSLVGKMDAGRFRFLEIPDSDQVRPLQTLRRAMSLRWGQCSAIFGQENPWLEKLAKSLGIGHKELVDRLILP